jgi:hypothetical protein
VPEALWRRYCYAGQIAESDKPDANRGNSKSNWRSYHRRGWGRGGTPIPREPPIAGRVRPLRPALAYRLLEEPL